MVLIAYNSSDELNGLLSYIGTLGSDKSEYLQYESVEGQDPEQLFYFISGNSYATTRESLPEYYVGLYLKKHVFGLSSFTIKTAFHPQNSTNHPLTWKIIGSIDEKNWNILDSHINDSVLNVQFRSVHFEAQEYAVRHIRFVSATSFSLRSLEFFGNLYPNNIIFPFCQINNICNMFSTFGHFIAVFILM